MYIQINSAEELVSELEDQIGQQVSFHYTCEGCGEEVTSSPMEITDSLIEDIDNTSFMNIDLECTSCGESVTFLSADEVNAIEIN